MVIQKDSGIMLMIQEYINDDYEWKPPYRVSREIPLKILHGKYVN